MFFSATAIPCVMLPLDKDYHNDFRSVKYTDSVIWVNQIGTRLQVQMLKAVEIPGREKVFNRCIPRIVLAKSLTVDKLAWSHSIYCLIALPCLQMSAAVFFI